MSRNNQLPTHVIGYHWLNCSSVGKGLRVTNRANVSEQCYAVLAREKCHIGQYKPDSLCEVTQLFIRRALAAIFCLGLGARFQGNYRLAGEALSSRNKKDRDLALKEKESLSKLELCKQKQIRLQEGKRKNVTAYQCKRRIEKMCSLYLWLEQQQAQRKNGNKAARGYNSNHTWRNTFLERMKPFYHWLRSK